MPSLDSYGGFYPITGNEVLVVTRYPNGGSPVNGNAPSGGETSNIFTSQLMAQSGGSSAQIVAAGTNQATATLLTATTSFVTSTPAGSGVVLPNPAAGTFTVYNQGANQLLVYPGLGGQIQGSSTNQAVILVANYGSATFSAQTPTLWNAQ